MQWFVFIIVVSIYTYVVYSKAPKRKLFSPLTGKKISDYHELLNTNNEYYRFLSESAKTKFIKRLHDFRNSKEFIGRDNFVVEEKHEVLISSAAIQITFGLEDYQMNHYETIIIFPEKFYFGRGESSYKGLTSQQGTICLSWKDFVSGYSTTEDKLNLGIHEMSHALELDAFLGNDTTMDFAVKYDEWKSTSTDEYRWIKDDGESFLRSYAGSSEREFFAVCMENFFEAPHEFEKQLPDIYKHLEVLLNQDPGNKENDYRLTN